jgi:hypothetical protein
MEKTPCVHCGTFFNPRNSKQNYCSTSDCQRARKAAWQRFKMRTDAEYRTQQNLSRQKCLKNNPYYWRDYRRRNPDKTERNRALQHIRNRRKRCVGEEAIAKMDARNPKHFELVGRFYLVPVIAKMDVSQVNIYTISSGYI